MPAYQPETEQKPVLTKIVVNDTPSTIQQREPSPRQPWNEPSESQIVWPSIHDEEEYLTSKTHLSPSKLPEPAVVAEKEVESA